MTDYVVASDLGTGSCKTVVLDRDARVVGAVQKEYPSQYPQPGWAEQQPQDWLEAVGVTVQEALQVAKVQPKQVAAFGLVGVTHNAVLLDEGDKPLRPCILYLDTRSQGECDDLKERWGNEIFRRSWNSMSPIWTWPQLLWVKRNEPDVWRRTRKILFQKDYVRHCLAPSPVSDVIDVEGSLLYDPIADCWIEDFVADLGLDRSVLPEAVTPTELVGKIDVNGAQITGLMEGTPVIAGTTDTAAEVFGAGALKPGQGTVKLASVGRITCVTNEPVDHHNSLNYRHVLDDLWYPGTATKFATASFRWLRDTMWCDDNYNEMDAAAAQIAPGSGGILFHPHLQGEWVPYWDSLLRGDFLGLTVRHGRGHLTRAVMEGVAFALRAGVVHAHTMGLSFDEIRLIGRGSVSDLWPQIIADTLKRSIKIPAERDAAFGIGLITGMGVGMFPKESEEIDALIQIVEQRDPDPECMALYDELFQIYQDADQALSAISHRLTAFEKNFR